MALQTYIHEENGRRCVNFRGEWLHMDHEPPEPGPREERDYNCRMDHLIKNIRQGSLFVRLEGEEADYDRGEFGMPGLGRSVSVEWNAVDEEGEDRQVAFLVLKRNIRTYLANRIVKVHVQEALDHFLARNAEYGDDNDFNLGLAGQYVDISRKVQKLKRRWWKHEPARDGEESDRVIVMELIGHLLMSMEYLDQAEEGDDGPTSGYTGQD